MIDNINIKIDVDRNGQKTLMVSKYLTTRWIILFGLAALEGNQ